MALLNTAYEAMVNKFDALYESPGALPYEVGATALAGLGAALLDSPQLAFATGSIGAITLNNALVTKVKPRIEERLYSPR